MFADTQDNKDFIVSLVQKAVRTFLLNSWKLHAVFLQIVMQALVHTSENTSGKHLVMALPYLL